MGKKPNKSSNNNSGKRRTWDKSSHESGKSVEFGKSKDTKPSKGPFDKEGNAKVNRINDPEWYTISDEIAKAVGNIPFSVFTGAKVNIFKETYQNVQANVPGIAVCKYVPTFNTNTSGDAVNLTARALYQWIRHANSGAKNYEAPDLMMYVLAMDSIYLAMHEIRRALTILNTYNITNKYFPDGILRTMGIDSNVKSNYANLVYRYNLLVNQINSFAVPNTFKIFNRRHALGSVLLSDEAERPTQVIVPVADCIYYFDGTTISTGSSLQSFKLFTDKLTYNPSSFNMSIAPGVVDYPTVGSQSPANNTFSYRPARCAKLGSLEQGLSNVEMMLKAVLANEDFNIMSGDILKAYGDNLFKIAPMTLEDVMTISYDADLLDQFRHSTSLDLPYASTPYDYSVYNNDVFNGAFPLQWKTLSGSLNNITEKITSRPTVYQQNGFIISSPNLTTGNLTKEIRGLPRTTQDIDLVATNMMAAGIHAFTSLLLTTDKEPTAPLVLEWTRLMIMLGTSRDTLPILGGNDEREVTSLISGTEIILGWLTDGGPGQTRLDRYASSGRGASVAYQWFQFPCENDLFRESMDDLYGIDSLTGYNDSIYAITVPAKVTNVYSSNGTSHANISKGNYAYPKAVMASFRHRPRVYYSTTTQMCNSTSTPRYFLPFPVVGEFEAKTATISLDMLDTLHNAAIYSLLASNMSK